MKKVVTFGELMLRLQPYDYLRFVQADSFEATFGGGEANVAVSLANYGLDAHYVTKLPKHAIGQMAVNSLRKYGVNTADITRGGDRVGIYFLEKGASQRGSVCIYDRAHSAIANSEFVLDSFQRFKKRRNFIHCCFPEILHINPEILVCKNISHGTHITDWNLWKPFYKIS